MSGGLATKTLTLIVALIGLLTPAAATAASGRLVSQRGNDVVFVWKDRAAHDEALQIIAAGAHMNNPALLMRLLACVVPVGTRVVIRGASLATVDVTVISGNEAGCRGNVATENFAQ